MSIRKYIDRINRIHNLIKRKSTGTPDEFAKKLYISKSVLLQNISELKELGLPIEYNRYRRTYTYQIDKVSENGVQHSDLSDVIMKQIFGGQFHSADISQHIIYFDGEKLYNAFI